MEYSVLKFNDKIRGNDICRGKIKWPVDGADENSLSIWKVHKILIVFDF